MATQTPNYNLIKPGDNDFYDINSFIGENMELIDAALKPTADPDQVPIGNVGKLAQWVSWLTNRIKAITGGANWYDAPDITLAAAATQITNEATARANADTALGNLISTHEAVTATNSAIGHVTADKYVLLWSGNTSTPGNLTLNSSCHNIYEAFIIQTGIGTTVTYFLAERPDDKFALEAASRCLVYYTYSGVGRLLGVDSSGLYLNLDTVGGQPLRSIYGITRGTKV